MTTIGGPNGVRINTPTINDADLANELIDSAEAWIQGKWGAKARFNRAVTHANAMASARSTQFVQTSALLSVAESKANERSKGWFNFHSQRYRLAQAVAEPFTHRWVNLTRRAQPA